MMLRLQPTILDQRAAGFFVGRLWPLPREGIDGHRTGIRAATRWETGEPKARPF